MDNSSGMTQGQLRKIWASARELGWDDDRVHRELEAVIGVESLQDLTVEHAKLFIDYLVSEGATPGVYHGGSAGGQTTQGANITSLASPAQRSYIAALVKDLHQTEDAPYYLEIVKRAIGHTRIRTMKEASVVIGILRKLGMRYQGGLPGTVESMGSEGKRGA